MESRSWIALAPFILACTFVAAGPQQTPISDLAWLAGCWERRTPTGSTVENWMAPDGGAMLGASRTVRGGRLVEYEFLRIYEREGRLVYAAMPSGQQPTEFTETERTASGVVFENMTHDFPQRIRYQQGVADSLFARIEGKRGDRMAGIDFRMARVACPGGK